MEEEQNPKHVDHRNRNLLVTVALGVLVALVIALGIVLTRQKTSNNGTSNNYSNNNNSYNGNGNTPITAIPDHTKGGESGGILDGNGSQKYDGLAEQDYTERREAIIALLEPLYAEFEGGVEVFDKSSPFKSDDRIKALEWLVKDNPMLPSQATATDENENENNVSNVNDTIVVSGETEIKNGNGNGNGNDQSAKEDAAFRVRQRYVLAVLYMSTDGEGWDEQYYFLSYHDVCDWTSIPISQDGKEEPDFNVKGAICNDKGGLENIIMCKSH